MTEPFATSARTLLLDKPRLLTRSALAISALAVACGSSTSENTNVAKPSAGGSAGSGTGGSGATGGTTSAGGSGATGGSGGTQSGDAGTGTTDDGVDVQVAVSGVLDPEFDMYSNRYTYCEQSLTQRVGKLWVGRFNPDGSFDDENAHPGTALDDCIFQINGPEWGRDNSGAVISYVKNDDQGNPTLAYVHEDAPDKWSVHIVPNLPELTASYNAVYPGDVAQDSARVLFVGMAGVEWRDLAGGPVPGTGGDLVSAEQGFPRWATQLNSIAILADTGTPAVKQLTAYDTDDLTTVQVSDDDGDKNNPHMWIDDKLGTIVAGAVGNDYEVFDLASKKKVLTIPSPNGMPMQSPEHFVYHGHSYIYYFVQADTDSGDKNADVYVTLIDADYKHLKVSGSQVMPRLEPEVAFPSDDGTPIIYFSAKGADGGNNAMWRSAVVALP